MIFYNRFEFLANTHKFNRQFSIEKHADLRKIFLIIKHKSELEGLKIKVILISILYINKN